jgi:phage-related protein
MTALTLPLSGLLSSNSVLTSSDRELSAQFGNGYAQVAVDGFNNEIEKWYLEYIPLDGDNLITLNTFLDTVKTNQWFYWTPLGETIVKKWRRVKDTKNRKMINFETYIVTFSITQAFDLGV